MAVKQIFGPFYWAGVPIPADGKYQARTDGTEAVAKVVTVVDADGVPAPSAPSSVERLPESDASTNDTLVKATAGFVHRVNGVNASAGVIYLKFYDVDVSPVVGTDAPVFTLALPASASFDYDLGGFSFADGIGFGLTTDAGDAGTTAIGSGDVVGLNIIYS